MITLQNASRNTRACCRSVQSCKKSLGIAQQLRLFFGSETLPCVHHLRHARVFREALAMPGNEVPIEQVERAGIRSFLRFHVKGASTAIIAHSIDVTCAPLGTLTALQDTDGQRRRHATFTLAKHLADRWVCFEITGDGLVEDVGKQASLFR